MKKIVIINIILLLNMPSCRYEEGPGISFRTVNERIQGYWHVDKFYFNGLDYTKDYFENFNCNIYFSDHNGHFTGPCRNGVGFTFSFDFNKNKTIIEMKIFDTPLLVNYGPFCKNCFSEWKIIKLSQMEFNLEADYNGNKYRMEMTKLYEI